MRLHAWAWLALSSFLIAPLAGATRPRYGGTLTVELSSAWNSLDPSDPSPQSKRDAVLPLVAETLVRVNQRGDIEPELALSWQRDADRKRWRFSLRPKVLFHDGEALNASSAAPPLIAALTKRYADVNVTAGGQTLVIQFDHAIPDLLNELALPGMAIFRTSGANPLIGTGPFRVMAWEPGRRLSLVAVEDYWGGRPFLDSVVINLGATRSVSDIFEIPFAPSRRVIPERARIWTSPSHELVALVADRVQPEVWDALALSIDRAPIVNVLAQRKAEAAFGLLPQWLTGYAFLFAGPTDIARAKDMVSRLRLNPLTLNYAANDGFARSVAERVAVNARDAGIVLQPTPGTGGNLRLVRWPLESAGAAPELSRLAEMLGLSDAANSFDTARPEALYAAERALLDAHRVIPVCYLPDVYGIASRVHNWDTAQKTGSFALHLESVWVDP